MKKNRLVVLIVVILLFLLGYVCMRIFTDERGYEKVLRSRLFILSKISERGATINCETPREWLGVQNDQRFMISPPKPTGSEYLYTPAITIHFYKPEDGFVSAEKYVSYLLGKKQTRQIGQTQKIKVAGKESFRFDTEEELPPLEDAGGPGPITIRNAYAITSWDKGFWVFRYSTAKQDFDMDSVFFEYLLKSCQFPGKEAPLLDFVDTLENFPALSPDGIAKILNVSLVETSGELSPYYFIREAKGSNIAGFFKSVELRTPTETNKGGLLILDLRDDLGITEKDILKKYPKAIPELAEATAPITVPYDWMVKKPWGKISFQITRDGSKRVVAVIFDSID